METDNPIPHTVLIIPSFPFNSHSQIMPNHSFCHHHHLPATDCLPWERFPKAVWVGGIPLPRLHLEWVRRGRWGGMVTDLHPTMPCLPAAGGTGFHALPPATCLPHTLLGSYLPHRTFYLSARNLPCLTLQALPTSGGILPLNNGVGRHDIPSINVVGNNV